MPPRQSLPLNNYCITAAKGRLPSAVRFLKPPPHSSSPDWPLINWKLRFVQKHFLPLVGAYPEIAIRRGLIRIARGWGAGGDIDLIICRQLRQKGEGVRGKRGSVSDSSTKEEKLERARLRLKRLSSCGSVGRVAFEEAGENSYKLKHLPHRCHSLFCVYCSRKDFKKTFARLLPQLEALAVNGQLTFLTLTLRNFSARSYEEVEACINEAFRAIQRLKDFRLFGRRNWERVMSAVEEELEAYYENAKKLYGEAEARKRVARHRSYIEDFIARYQELIGDSSFRFYQLGNWVVKFELTYNAKTGELHPHWHIITDVKLPKLLITAVWRLLTGSQIVDIRAVKSTRDAAAELSKYMTKAWEFPEGADDVRLWVEAAMLGRRKLRVWGFEMLELEGTAEEKKEKVVVAWWLVSELANRKNLSFVPKLARRMRRKGIREAVVDEVLVYDSYSGMVWRGQLVLTDDEELYIRSRDPDFWRAMDYHYDAAMLMGVPPDPAEDIDLSEIEF